MAVEQMTDMVFQGLGGLFPMKISSFTTSFLLWSASSRPLLSTPRTISRSGVLGASIGRQYRLALDGSLGAAHGVGLRTNRRGALQGACDGRDMCTMETLLRPREPS